MWCGGVYDFGVRRMLITYICKIGLGYISLGSIHVYRV